MNIPPESTTKSKRKKSNQPTNQGGVNKRQLFPTIKTAGTKKKNKPNIPEVIKRGPYIGQPIRPMTPERRDTIVSKVKNEFPKTPTQNSLQGRLLEVTQMSYLESPREGGTKHNVFDANSISTSFPSVDIFSTSQEDNSPFYIQSKAHLMPSVDDRVSSHRFDLASQNTKNETLSKRVHPENPSQWKNFGEPLTTSLKNINFPNDDRNLFKRTELSDSMSVNEYDTDLEKIHDKREKLFEHTSRNIIFPTSPKTSSELDSPHFPPMPVSTTDISNMVDSIPHKPRKAPTKRSDPDADEYTPDG